MDDIASQFHAKYLMDSIGNSMASILLIYIGNKTGNNDFITAGRLYFQRYVKKIDYDNDTLSLCDSLINIEGPERLIKNR